MGKNQFEEMDEEMTVELELDDGTNVTCAIITILEVEGNDYIVLMPLDEQGQNDDGEVLSLIHIFLPLTAAASWTRPGCTFIPALWRLTATPVWTAPLSAMKGTTIMN